MVPPLKSNCCCNWVPTPELKIASAAAAWYRVPFPGTKSLLLLLYIGTYVGNIPPLRGLCWASGLLCSGILYLEGLKAVLQ